MVLGRASSGSSRFLVGRAAELNALHHRAKEARAGRASVVTLLGPAGIGKTSVLRAFLDDEAFHGVTVLDGACSEVASGAGYGGVRALFGSLGLAAEHARNSPLLHGVAGRALPALAPDPADEKQSSPESVYATMHGLYWLAANLMSEGPLALVLDDVHWCDERSLRWVDFLLRRADDLPLLIVFAQRSEAEPVAPAALADIATCGRSETIPLAPLGEEDIAEMVRHIFPATAGTTVDPSFAARAASVSGGNPLTFRSLLHELQAEGVRPDAAGARRITEVGGQVVALSLRGLLDRQPDGLRDVAAAIALLGERAPELVGNLAGVSPSVMADSVMLLRRAELVAPDRMELVQDVVRSAVLDVVGAATRKELMIRAAQLLSDAGRPPEDVANQLLLLPDLPQPWMPDVLRDAATQAQNRGAPEAAARYLHRALEANPDSVPLRMQLAHCVAEIDPAEAFRVLEEVLTRPIDVRTKSMVAVQFGRIALSAQRAPTALRVLEESLAALDAELGPSPDPADQELRTLVEAVTLIVGTDEKSTLAAVRDRAAQMAEPPGDTPAQRQMLATLTTLTSMNGDSAQRTAEQARRVLYSPGAASEGWELLTAGLALSLADEVDDCLDALNGLLQQSQERAAIWSYAMGLSFRAIVLQGLGAIPDALADAQTSFEIIGQESWGEGMTVPQIALALVLIDRGEPSRAEEVLRGIKRKNLDRFVMEYHWYLLAKARARWALGDREAALGLLLECGSSMEAARINNPAFAPWWADAACVLSELGRPDEARELTERGGELARRWGTRRVLGHAALARGVITPGRKGVELLTESTRILGDSVARAEHARAEYLLGRALLAIGDQRSAREQLHAAVDHAQRCGALALTGKAHRDLVTAGGRMRRMSTSPLDMLTGTERKVAGLAASGTSNRSIAESLFVTVRTVETHLTSAYRKLGVTRRVELDTILHAPDVPDSRPPAWGSTTPGGVR